ncbi:beta-lactamase [Ignicoccus pacificus DSM 13166]|uniref:Beta-lactamase n=1 Tax=Ignicoccus pacificus DSM 13166 TaxID=940294 RepID=A0A977PK72_9CREN|nr:beta-lactamase [Ignicoccus pacificus DSM 13166]
MKGVNYTVNEVLPNLYQLKLLDKRTKYFEAMWEIPEGVTYNAYLYKGEKVVLFDGWKIGYGELLVKTLSELTDHIDYYVIHHMEPDHSGSFKEVVSSFKPKVLGHPMVKTLASEYYRIPFEFKALKDGEELDVGLKLRFLFTPWLHWPETIMTYVQDYKAILTCDAFGSFGFEQNLWLSRKYFMTVVGKYKDFVIRAVPKLSSLEIEKVLPAHGPLWGKEIIDEWVKWAKGEELEKATLIYGSMYGFSKSVVNKIVSMLRERGVEVHVFGFNDTFHALVSEILTDIVDSKYIVVISPTYEGGPFWPVRDVVDTIAEKAKYKKRVLIVNTCGWGCVPAPYKSSFEKGGYDVRTVITIKGSLRDEDVKKLEEGIERLLES